MTDREAMKLALEALELWHNAGEVPSWYGRQDRIDAMNAIRQALAEPDMGIDRGAWDDVPDATKWVDELRGGDETEQEPVAHLWECIGRWSAYLATNGTQADCAPPDYLVEAVKVATAPPKREWKGLTDEEIDKIAAHLDDTTIGWSTHEFARAIEAKLREKNHAI